MCLSIHFQHNLHLLIISRNCSVDVTVYKILKRHINCVVIAEIKFLTKNLHQWLAGFSAFQQKPWYSLKLAQIYAAILTSRMIDICLKLFQSPLWTALSHLSLDKFREYLIVCGIQSGGLDHSQTEEHWFSEQAQAATVNDRNRSHTCPATNRLAMMIPNFFI